MLIKFVRLPFMKDHWIRLKCFYDEDEKYGEFFINFGWTGAILGALLYGTLVAYLDDRFRAVHSQHVRGVFLALTISSAVFAQIGQLDLFTSTLTGFGYPLALIALLARRRAA